jgi:pentatricopeptide repeat protein
MLNIKRIDPNDKTQYHYENHEVYLPKCLVLLSGYPYLAAFREYLTQIHRLSKMGEMILPIERYICNFCAEIPAPPPGSFEVQTTILDSVIKMWSPPHNLPIAWVSLPFTQLFECLDVDNIILVWHCLALERQVLITSTQLSILTTATEIFLSLLFPMRWSHAYIPVLPHFLIPILSAPMPFLCGIHKSNLADALYDLSRDCVLVDLDKNTVTLGPDTLALPPLPPVQEAALRSQLERNVGMVFREVRSLTRTDDYSDSGQNLHGHIKLMAEAMWESKLMLYDEAFHLIFTPEQLRKNLLNGNDNSGMEKTDSSRTISLSATTVTQSQRNNESRVQSPWDAVQEAFLDTSVYLLRNYRQFLVFPSKHNEGSYGGAGFRSKEFIESQRYDMREFLHQLVGTQMFDTFITKRLYGSGEADVTFFDMAVDRFLKNAGMFANVDFAGRVSSGLKAATSSSTASERHNITKSLTSKRKPVIKAMSKKNEEPLLQSARVHRKLKTIVPPEPTGEGLPPNVASLLAGIAEISQTANGSVSNIGFDDDDASVNSSRSTGTNPSRISNAPSRSTRLSAQEIADEILSKKGTFYTYHAFPSTLNAELFGTPRPLPAAVIAEFDRQRKDAVQIRRKSARTKTKDNTQHIQRAHSTVDPDVPPSPEVATFTVFFMAFTGLVGKELIEMAQNGPQDRTILSTYVQSGNVAVDEDDISVEGVDSDPVDVEEKEGVAAMKTSRPMNGMFNEDDENNVDPVVRTTNGAITHGSTIEQRLRGNTTKVKSTSVQNEAPQTKAMGKNNQKMSSDGGESVKSTDSKPKDRFRDKLSDLQIEEAKTKGRAQLGLAFEMLTMMKKRALQADPEAYQCLIDACGRVGDTKRATELLSKMHEDGIVADGTVYACLVSAFSAESAWKDKSEEELPEWANSTAVDMDWNKLQKRSFFDRIISQVVDLDDDDDVDNEEGITSYQKLRKRIANRSKDPSKGLGKVEDRVGMEFFVTETVERQIALGENLLEIVFPDISIDTENEICPRCNFVLSDDDVVNGWTPGQFNDYTTSCPNCTQRFVPHFCVQCSSPTFVGSRGLETPLMCERLSPWVLQKEIRSVMSDFEGTGNLLNPEWREKEYKNAVLWWNLVLSCMRYRFPFSFLLQGSFEQNLIAPMPED